MSGSIGREGLDLRLSGVSLADSWGSPSCGREHCPSPRGGEKGRKRRSSQLYWVPPAQPSSLSSSVECGRGIFDEKLDDLYFQVMDGRRELGERIASLQDFHDHLEVLLKGWERKGDKEEVEEACRLLDVAVCVEEYWTQIETLQERWREDPSLAQLKRRVDRGDLPLSEGGEDFSPRREEGLERLCELHYLEGLDPLRRPWGTGWLRSLVEKWEEACREGTTSLHFFPWLEKAGEGKECFEEHERSSLSLNMRCKGLVSEEERQPYRVEVRGGHLYQGDRLLDTTAMHSLNSGDGKAIFVLGAEGKKLYSAEHQAGTFHHSTFFSGAQVAAAGDWRVEEGKLRVISNKSGHYQPHWKTTTLKVLRYLEERGVNLSEVDFEAVTSYPCQAQVIGRRGESLHGIPLKVLVEGDFGAKRFLDEEGRLAPSYSRIQLQPGWERKVERFLKSAEGLDESRMYVELPSWEERVEEGMALREQEGSWNRRTLQSFFREESPVEGERQFFSTPGSYVDEETQFHLEL